MKQKTMTVPVFKKGDKVIITSSGFTGIVKRQSGLNVIIQIVGRGDFTRLCVELKLLNTEEYNKLQPKKLKVRTLDRELIVSNNTLKAGCQTLSKADALAVANFILKHLK